MGRYLKTRDSAELDVTMRRLDAEQEPAAATAGAESLTPEEVVVYLRICRACGGTRRRRPDT